MEEKKCMCGKIIPKEKHTGKCQLNHWLSYMCGVVDKESSEELRRIVEVIICESKE